MKGFMRFRVGTCTGVYSTEGKFGILGIENSVKGNGHFEDVLQWFEFSAKRVKVRLYVLEVWNKRLMDHLIEKRGFTREVGTSHVYKDL